MECRITHRGVEIPTKLLYQKIGADGVGKLLAALTLKHERKVGAPLVVKLWECITTSTPIYILPRTMIPRMALLGISPINTYITPIRTISAPLILELYQNQRIVVNRLLEVFTPDRIAAGTAGAILNMRAGLGKTFTAAGVISALSMRSLIIVTNSELARQMYDDLTACFGESVRIGLLGGKVGKRRKHDTDDDITIAVINSALTRPREWSESYSFILYDEVHAYCSTQRRKIFTAANHHVRMGMSATTDNRADEMDQIAHNSIAIDGVIFAEKLAGFSFEDVKFRTIVSQINYKGPPEYTKTIIHPSTGKMFTPWMMKQFFADPYRSRIIYDRAIRRYNESHNVYIFAEELAALTALHGELVKVLPPDEVVLFTGGIDEEDAARARSTGRILLATYGYAGTGISIVKMSAIIFMSPRRENMLQILARILRRGSDVDKIRSIDDIVDAGTPMRSQFYSRKGAYAEYEMEIKAEKISWTSLTPLPLLPLPAESTD